MIARTLTVQVEPDRIDPILEAYREDVLPIHERAAGLRQHYVLVDRERGLIEIVGVWDSAEDVAHVAPPSSRPGSARGSDLGRSAAGRLRRGGRPVPLSSPA